MGKTLICVVAMMGLCATTGCMAPVESEEIEAEAAEAEQVGEGEEALSVAMSCAIVSAPPPSFGTIARITNNSPHVVPFYASIDFTVEHTGSTPDFSSAIDGPLAKNASVDVPLTHSGSLDAFSCTARANW